MFVNPQPNGETFCFNFLKLGVQIQVLWWLEELWLAVKMYSWGITVHYESPVFFLGWLRECVLELFNVISLVSSFIKKGAHF